MTQTCEGSTVQLTATGTGTFSWSGPAGWVSNNQSPVITNIPLYMSGVFTVTPDSIHGLFFDSKCDDQGV
nr:hypothetical protein [Candidatus Brachybacter algidus]